MDIKPPKDLPPSLLHCKSLCIKREDFSLTASFELKLGDRLAITAPSGHGKTTLLMMIAGFSPYTSGNLLFKGAPIIHLPPNKRPFACLFQENNLFAHLTVLENIALAFGRLQPTTKQKSLIQRLLEEFKVESFMNRYPQQLSGGQVRRISLARCMLLERPILLLDEPFTGVDDTTIKHIADYINSNKACTLIFTSHNPQEIKSLANRRYML